MRNLLWLTLLLSLAIFVTSCQKDSVLGGGDLEEISANRYSKMDASTSFKGVSNNGSWLVFSNEAAYESIYKSLTYAIDKYEDNAKETDDFTDPEPVLADFERNLRHRSLRYKLAREEYKLMDRARNPADALNQLEDKGVDDEIVQSFLNEDGIVQIGRAIFYIPKEGLGVKIVDGNTKALYSIMENGIVERFNPAFANSIEVFDTKTTNGKETIRTFECDASFRVVSQTYNSATEKYEVVFAWSQSDDSAAFTGELTWDFGDGSTPLVTEQTIVSHSYATFGTYTAILSIDGVVGEGDDQVVCKESNYTVVTIQEHITNTEIEFCDILEAALVLMGEEQVGNIVLDSDTQDGGLAFSTSGLLSIVASIEDVPDEQIVWTISGVEKTGHYAFFPFDCEGTKSGSVKIGDCTQITFKVDYDTANGCEQGNLDGDFDRVEYNGGQRSLCFSSKTRSKTGFLIFFSTSNKIKVKAINYRKKNNGGWKRKKADLQAISSGNVHAENACECEAPLDASKTETANNKKKVVLKKTFNQHEGINYNSNEPWYFTLKVDGSTIVNNQEAHP